MNKIFKIIWNRTIGSFVITSELAKGRVKSSSEGAEGDMRASEEGRLKTLFRLTALSAALLGFSEGAWAIITPFGQVANGENCCNNTYTLAAPIRVYTPTNTPESPLSERKRVDLRIIWRISRRSSKYLFSSIVKHFVLQSNY